MKITNPKPRFALWTLAVVAGLWLLYQMTPKPRTPGEEQARAVLNSTFDRAHYKRWYALKGDTLIELQNPVIDLRPLPALNQGERLLLTVGCDRYRTWQGDRWSGETLGTSPSMDATLNTLTTAEHGFWSVTIEARPDGSWAVTDRLSMHLTADLQKIQTAVQAAGVAD